jgi:4-hydroxy-tetrahydrodipicolinate synthase
MIDDIISGRMEQAAATHRRLIPLVNALYCIANPIPIKYALNQIGFNVGSCRLPLTEADDKSAALIRATLKDIEIDLPLR